MKKSPVIRFSRHQPTQPSQGLGQRRRRNGTTRWECEKYLCDTMGTEFCLAEGRGDSPEEACGAMLDELRIKASNLQKVLEEMEESR